jgi:hypothetical protein
MSFHEGGFDTKLTLTKGRARLESIPRSTIQVQQTLKSAAAVSSSTRTDRAANGRWSCPFNNAQGHCTSNPIPLPGIKLRRTSHSETEQLNFRQPGILHTNSSPPPPPPVPIISRSGVPVRHKECGPSQATSFYNASEYSKCLPITRRMSV